jgi:hypothetical protein
MNITGSAKRKRVDASTLNVSSTSSLQGDVTAFQDVSILGNLSNTTQYIPKVRSSWNIL